MIPLPIALLSVFFGLLAATSAMSVWSVMNGAVHKPLVSQVAWLLLSAGAMIGLPLRKTWGLWCAIACAWLVVLSVLAIAAWLIASGAPGWGLGCGLGTVVPLTAIRYLTRPNVKQWFVKSDSHLLSMEK